MRKLSMICALACALAISACSTVPTPPVTPAVRLPAIPAELQEPAPVEFLQRLQRIFLFSSETPTTSH